MKTCQDITQDIERSTFERLSLKNRMELKLHLSICPDCKSYFKDSRLIDKLLAKKYKNKIVYKYSKLEKEALKERLQD